MTTDASAVPEAPTYVDLNRSQAERWAIFARQWPAIGAVDQLAAPGAYVSAWVARYALVVVNDDGILQAFPNVCRQQARPPVDEGSGACGRLVCRYHGWAYALDGRPSSARDFGAEVDAADFAVLPAHVAAWRGLLFVALEPSEPDVEVWLASVTEHSASFPMESFEVTQLSSHDLAANWKTYAENYQEGDHIPLVHPGLNRQIDAARCDVEIDGVATAHTTPTRDGSVTTGAWPRRFPGFALNLYPSGMCIESYWPTGPTSTRVEYTFCFVPGTPAEEAEIVAASSVAILDADRVICEAVQRNLASGLARPDVLSLRHESGVALVQTLVADAIKEHHR